MNETLETLLGWQEEIDRQQTCLQELGALLPNLHRQITLLQRQMAPLSAERDQARVDLETCLQAARDLPQVNQALADAHTELSHLTTQGNALDTVIVGIRRLLDVVSGPRPDPRVIASIVQQINNALPDLPPEANALLAPLLGRLRRGSAPTPHEVQVLLERLDEIRSQIARQTNQLQRQIAVLNQRQAQLNDAIARMPTAQTRLDQAEAALLPLEERLATMQEQLREAEDQVAQLQQSMLALQVQLEDALRNLFRRVDPTIPLALLPVRLETRFIQHWNEDILAIRIYPDDIHQNQHRPELSASERQGGDLFTQRRGVADTAFDHSLQQTAKLPAGPQQEAARHQAEQSRDEAYQQAWHELAGRFGPNRAAWIARVYAHSTALPPIDPQPNPFAAYAELLPDRWVALGYRAGQRVFTTWGSLIGQRVTDGGFAGGRLATGMTHPDTTTASGLDDNGAWLVDFDRALAVGMAIRVPLPGGDDAFDRVLVLGVRATRDADESAADLQAVLDAHHYTWGLGFVPPGTPTNNTAEARTGLPGRDSGHQESYRLECGPPQVSPLTDPAPEEKPDGLLVAEALGLVPAIFDHVPNARAETQARARDMQIALWPATLEYFLETLFLGHQGLEPLGSNGFEKWRRYYCDVVRAAGPLPLLRAGSQPYGVLPVTSLDHWQPINELDRLDILAYTVDAAAGVDDGRLLTSFDVEAPRMMHGWAEAPLQFGRTAPAILGGLALTDLASEGRHDLLLLRVEGATGPFVLMVGHSLRPDGTLPTKGWNLPQPVPIAPGGRVVAAGLAAGDLNGNGHLEVAVLHVEEVTDAPGFYTIYVQLGRIEQPSGSVRWEGMPRPLTIISEPIAASLATADLDGDGKDELVLFWVVSEGGQNQAYLATYMLDGSGNVQPVAPARQLIELTSALPRIADARLIAAQATIAVDAGRRELVLLLHMQARGDQEPLAYLARGHELTANGGIAVWSGYPGITLAAPRSGNSQQLLGVVAGSLGRTLTPNTASASGRANILARLRDEVWKLAVGGVPALPLAKPDDVDQQVVSILGLSGIAAAVRGRTMLDANTARSLLDFGYPGVPASWAQMYYQQWQAQTGQVTNFLRSIGLQKFDPRLIQMVFERGTFTPDGPLVVEPGKGVPDPIWYISWLCDAPPHEILNVLQKPARETPMLFRLLAFATLRTYVKAGQTIVFAQVTEPTDVDVGGMTSTTAARYLIETKAASGLALGDELHTNYRRGGTQSASSAGLILIEFFDALLRLAKTPPADLERLMLECLDLGAQRLDAWITSLATLRLRELRQHQPHGIQVGGYGWIENLKKKVAGSLTSAGYTHAPSLNQAATAAILRSGYLAHHPSGADRGLAMQLTSARVRKALWLIDGVHQGQSLAALLGYQFERALQAKNLNLMVHLKVLRQLYPLNANKLNRAAGAVEDLEAHDVVDGLKMIRAYRSDPDAFPFGKYIDPPGVFLPEATSDEGEQIVEVLRELLDHFDAVADLSIAEAVYQAAMGNPVRAAASLDAVSRGEVPLSDLEIIRTPRTGTSLSHRLLALFGQGTSEDAAGPWEPKDASGRLLRPNARRIAEPNLDRWAAVLFGSPAAIRCTVLYTDPAKHNAPLEDVPPLEPSLDALGFGPLDLLYLEPSTPSADDQDTPFARDSVSEIEQRVAYYALVGHRPKELAWDRHASVKITFDYPAPKSGQTTPLGLAQALEVARAARSLLTQARPLEAADLLHPSVPLATVAMSHDADKILANRGNTLRDNLTGAIDDLREMLNTHVPDKGKPDLANLTKRKALGDALLALADLGVPNSMPSLASSTLFKDWITFVQQCDDALAAAEQRKQLMATLELPELSSLAPAPNSEQLRERLRTHVRRIRVLFGEGFQVVPPFSLTMSEPATEDLRQPLRNSVADLAARMADTPEVVDAWFQRVSRVRDGARRLHQVMRYAEVLSPAARLDFTILQLPATPGETWVGMTGEPIPPGRISLVAHMPCGVDLDQPLLAGLMIDAWNEVVPNRNEITSVTFHYDAPNAAAPQAILLAVSPHPNQPWDLVTLEALLQETLDLAKMRAVTLQQIAATAQGLPSGSIAQFLPALYYPLNAAGDTITVRFKG